MGRMMLVTGEGEQPDLSSILAVSQSDLLILIFGEVGGP